MTRINKNPLLSPRALSLSALTVLLVDSLIALVLWGTGVGPFDQQLVYAQGIGLSIWVLISAGAVWLARPDDPGGFPQGARALALVLTGVALGYLLGLALGDAYAGRSSWQHGSANPRLGWSLLAMTLGVGVLVTNYFYTLGKSRYLQGELERQQRQASEAQLKLLQTQLEPHMLFNTLANLRVLIALDAPRAQTMLDHLIAYLRATLSASRASRHPLADEFARLRDYLELMAVRMGPRLQFELELPPALAGVPVPPLLLQPLVENSIRHGLEPKIEGGCIHISAQADGDWLQLEVRDSGVGCAPERLALGSGFGLSQVRERLASVYGPAGTIEAIAIEAGGVSVKLRFRLQND